MAVKISQLSHVDPRANLGENVEIGPFCHVGPDVTLGAGCELLSHVSITGHATIGERNRFFPGAVIGGEPQDSGYSGAPTRLEIGHENIFREGVTVNRGADKEDHTTRIGHQNLLMANSHVGHNCHVQNRVILVNGCLLGGHVHVHDGAILSGNVVVHHFSTVGMLAFVSGGCRVPHDIPPFMLASGSDNPVIKTINIVGMRRAGITPESIEIIKRAHRLLYRAMKPLDEVRAELAEAVDGIFPFELSTLLNFLDKQRRGKLGRAREIYRNQVGPAPEPAHNRRAA
ncbi:MAG TPA: acyl-ACP--UDP-N-acetylglucosamine O-acyltransferase [Planctomycetaceae bacterium]|jgi:UDP-N-acetylglucosamine acyltransferase|nr:acyl-ACP--UDP-N-acetylglucosamine O-acyltransferase [Planctomycetaceae bacterium]